MRITASDKRRAKDGNRHAVSDPVMMALAVLAVALMCQGQQIDAPSATQISAPDSLVAAQQLMHDGQFGQAETILRRLIAIHANAPESHYLLAYALLREDKAPESLKEYTNAAALRTPTATELRNVALDYVLLNDLPDADRWINQSLEMDSNDAETWYVRGRLRYTQGRYDEAVRSFQKALQLNTHSVKSENNLGLALEALGKNDDAARAYRAAIEWQNTDPAPSEQPLLNLAILLEHGNQLSEALHFLEQAAKIAPKEPRVYENLGQVYLHMAKLADAVTAYEVAVRLTPENARYHFLLGQAYRRIGEDLQAKQEFGRSAALNGTHSTIDK